MTAAGSLGAPTTVPADGVVLSARGVRKTFGGVTALDSVDFTLRRGEIHGLIGANGAGKSTLVKVLNGVHRPDAGTLELDGAALTLDSPFDARRAGIAMVFQEFSLIPTLSVAHNIFLGHEPRTRTRLTDERAARAATKAILDDLGVAVDPTESVGMLPVGSQQLVEIAKAMAWDPSILILDEPTASLSGAEVETLFRVLATLKARGVSIVYISHHLGEIMAICDAITVLRDGCVQLTGDARSLGMSAVVSAMTGRDVGAVRGRSGAAVARAGTPTLALEGWTLGTRLVDVAITLHPGEVLGVAGLLGSGRTSLLRSIVGLEPGVRGDLQVAGRSVRFGSPADAANTGVAYVPEDRRREGIIAGQTVEANLLLGVWGRLVRHFLLDDRAAERQTRETIARLDVRTSGPDQLIEHLSGGNQQKVVVGRALAREPAVLLLDDPTAGIDIASRRELLGHIRRYADAGGSVILVSSELEELAGVADRVAILTRGHITGVLEPGSAGGLSEGALLDAIHVAATAA